LHVASEDKAQYWVTQQRLMRHANRCQGHVDAVLVGQDEDVGTLNAIHSLGDLYTDTDQGKLDEAEQMYDRALAVYTV
jgi:hypothetical protein